MRLMAIIGVVLIGLLGAAFVLKQAPDLFAGKRPGPGLTALEKELERPFVLFVDGAVSPEFEQALATLDEPVGALADRPELRTLLDLDVYVMVRDSWDVFRTIQNHDLAALIRQRAEGQAPDAAVTWFDTVLSGPEQADKNVLVILAARTGLSEFSDVCFALTIYDLARYSRNGAAFIDAADGPGTQWKQCRAEGWTSVDDITGDG